MRVIKFSASWCGQCKALDPILKKCFPGVEVEEVDVDSEEAEELMEQYNIRNIPTFVVVKDSGEEVVFRGLKTRKEIEDGLER